MLRCALVVVLVCASHVARSAEVDFNRDVRKILADKCFACHGPDAEEVQADLRLDLRESAVGTKIEPGPIRPGKPDDSEFVRRVLSTDPEQVMPPPGFHKELTDAEKELLRRWVAEGAEYKDHWAFIKPVRPSLPSVKNEPWVTNPVDRFVLARLENEGLKPAAEASRETLVRRVSLDLRGFPPSWSEVLEFVRDDQPKAYERMVRRMLDSPHFGEKMARIWMDLARYGDTNGFHYDSTRQVWLWRDWVIRAYNENMPFDQFTIEQLAGDLIPDATLDQKVASGFNRNTRYNEEGGADPAEWLVYYAKDRTNTLGQVWLGMTLNCCECHSHKYDPISQQEYYQVYAFFNSMTEPGAQGHRQKYPPLIQVPTDDHARKTRRSEDEIARLKKEIVTTLAKVEYAEPADLPETPQPRAMDVVWIDDEAPQGAKLQGEGSPAWQWVTAKAHPVNTGKRSTRRSGQGLSQHFFTGVSEPLVIEEGDVLFAYVWLDLVESPKTVQLQFNDGNWEHRAYWGENLGHGGGSERPGNHRVGDLPEADKWVRLEVPAADVGLKPGAKVNGWAFTQVDGLVYYDTAGVKRIKVDKRYERSLAAWETRGANDKAVPEPVRKAIAVESAKRTAEQHQAIRDYYLEHVFAGTRGKFATLHKQIKAAEDELKRIGESIPFQLVSVEMDTPREAHMLIRGDFQKKGDVVERDVPGIFPRLPDDQPRNRLGLAHWVVGDDHPLTARVAVNRYWAQLFGRGIVETVGDFGHLGRFPSHPALLDWLAVEFVESGWDTKHMIELMVTSAAYRQSSVNDHRHDREDPGNHLLWRARRYRMPAEEIRDSVLQIAGMLSPKIGGPPVYPFQPQDYYKGKKGGWTWELSQGEDRYRRGMYTFWRRTTPYPTFVIFDAPDRTECTVSRARTNTPLQALTTMNDPQFVEAARVLAQRVLQSGKDKLADRIAFAFQMAAARNPSPAESAVLAAAYEEQLAQFKADPEGAAALTKVGEFERPADLDTVEHAAWTAIANVLLNLDETITRE